MSHLVVENKVFGSREAESTDSEMDSKELKRQTSTSINKIVYSDKKIDRGLVLLYKASKTKENLSFKSAQNDFDRSKSLTFESFDGFANQFHHTNHLVDVKIRGF